MNEREMMFFESERKQPGDYDQGREISTNGGSSRGQWPILGRVTYT